jgi:uncharacterized OB-fold protein
MADRANSATANLLAAAVALPATRVSGRRSRRCAVHQDQDAVTLAAEAVSKLIAQAEASPRALLFATTTPPYEEGGSAQPIVELAGLDSDLFVCDLTATVRDGLAAVRLAAGLVAAGTDPVVVVASNLRRDGADGDSGDGAVALLIGAEDGLARLTPATAHAEELRDRWRLPGESEPREADSSFLAHAGPERLVPLVLDEGIAAAVYAPQPRFAAKAERALGGAGDPASTHTGLLGAAHPLLRLLLGLAEPGATVATTGGLVEVLRHEPTGDAGALVAEVRAEVEGGEDVGVEPRRPGIVGTDIWSSGPRAWRERGQDLRLEGVEVGGRKVYPPPAAVGEAADGTPFRLSRQGTVLTRTVDRVYPLAEATGMAMVDLDDGVRFYCQVAEGQEVEIGQRVELVPRRLHSGGGIVQYFWKAAPCR